MGRGRKDKVMKNTIYLFLSVLLICTGCPESSGEPDSTLIIINNSNETIVHYDEVKAPGDTSLATITYPQTAENTASAIINPHETVRQPDAFKEVLNENPNHVLMLYLFSRDTIELVSWERIVDEQLILKRYDLTLEDLEDMDWVIAYP